jgi:hypothetical protein
LAAEKHKSTFLAPVGIGIAFFLAELVGTLHLPRGLRQSLLIWPGRGVLHWRFVKSSPLTGAGSREPPLSRIFLDLLAWAHPGIVARMRLLHATQGVAVEGMQPRSRLVSPGVSAIEMEE